MARRKEEVRSVLGITLGRTVEIDGVPVPMGFAPVYHIVRLFNPGLHKQIKDIVESVRLYGEIYGEEAAKNMVLQYLEELPFGDVALKFVRDNAGAASIEWLIGVVVLVFVLSMLLPMIIDQVNLAAASTSGTSASMLQKIPDIIVLVVVISILIGAFYYRRQQQ